jgi:hypothetical protein
LDAKSHFDDTTVRKPKRARAARAVTPGGGEASGERSVAQAAEGTPHGLASSGLGQRARRRLHHAARDAGLGRQSLGAPRDYQGVYD